MCGGDFLVSKRAYNEAMKDNEKPVDETQEVEVAKVKEQQAKPSLAKRLLSLVGY
jgi:hypothetical protein